MTIDRGLTDWNFRKLYVTSDVLICSSGRVQYFDGRDCPIVDGKALVSDYHSSYWISVDVLVKAVSCFTTWGLDILEKLSVNKYGETPTDWFWETRDGGIPDPRMVGCFLIPCFSRYCIDKDLNIFNVEKSLKMSPYYDKYGYIQFGLTPDVGPRMVFGQHRVVGLSFKKVPWNFRKLDVNHIDGVKDNNNPPNLEWATRKRNCDHAYSTNLRKDNKPVLVMDVRDGSVRKFYSSGDCGRCLNIVPHTVSWRAKSQGQTLYCKRYLFKYEDCQKPWRVFNSTDIQNYSHSKKVGVLLDNGIEQKTFFRRTDAISFLNVSVGAFYKAIQKEKQINGWKIHDWSPPHESGE